MDAVLTLSMSSGRPDPATEAEDRWLDAALGGDGDAFAELVRRHERRVFRLAGRFFRRREDVEDVAQETFLAAWRKRRTYARRAPFEHWLTRVCLRCCYRRLETQRRRRGEASLGAEPAAEMRDPDAALEVGGLLARLDPRDRFMLLLLDGEGWSTAEIAEAIGWSRANVKVRAHRARRKLRAVLESGGEP